MILADNRKAATRHVSRVRITGYISILLFVFAFTLSCGPNTSVFPDSKNNSVKEKMKTGKQTLYMETYEQKIYSYSLPPEAGIGLNKSPNNEQIWQLDSYEHTAEKTRIDMDGYLSIEFKWLNENADITIPPEIYAKVKDIMPSHGAGYDPVVSGEINNGYIRYFTKNGKTAYEYRLTPPYLRLMKKF